MYSAKAVANFFLQKGDDDNIPISPMKILKLVYVAHGWYLAMVGKPLIKDKIEAWEYGPVIPELYHEFRHFGRGIIKGRAQERIIPTISTIENQVSEVEFTTEQFLDAVWNAYKDFTAAQLSSMTHQPNTPWDITKRKSRSKRNPQISNKVIQEYYSEMNAEG